MSQLELEYHDLMSLFEQLGRTTGGLGFRYCRTWKGVYFPEFSLQLE